MMEDDNPDQLKVSFPASAEFTSIGRVAISGLAMRLGIDLSAVNELRPAVDLAVEALRGQGQIQVDATWSEQTLTLKFTNDDATISTELSEKLKAFEGSKLSNVCIKDSVISLVMPD